MENKHYGIWRWWQTLLLLLLCLFGGSSPVRAGCHFGDYSSIQHHPTVNEPWIEIRLMFYDTNNDDSDGSGDGFFLHNVIDHGVPGPDLYVDNYYVCSPNWELAWPGDDNKGNDKGLEKHRSEDGWWGDIHTSTNPNNGQSYIVRFWNPSKANGRFYCSMFIYLSKWHVGDSHTVRIKGKWKINNVGSKTEEASWTVNAMDSPFSSSPTAVMNDYGNMLLSGTLNKQHGPTTVGTSSNVSWNSLSLIDPDALESRCTPPYGKGQERYSNLSLPFARTDWYQTQKKPVEYVIEEKVNHSNLNANEQPDVKIFQWFNVSVPGFIRAKQGTMTYDKDLWNKKLVIKWEHDLADTNSSKNGKWYVYRDGKLLTTEGKSVNNNGTTESYEDTTVPEYDKQYTYKVVFVPNNSPASTLRSELSSEKVAILDREPSFFSNLKASNDYEDKIVFSWSHPTIETASSSNAYTIKVERSTDKKNWDKLEDISITDKNLTTGSYEDKKDLHSFVTYYYRLQINVMEKNYTSTICSGQLDGMSKITAFSASRGTYSNMVKLKWEAKQVGNDETYYTIYRRPLGSGKETDWKEIYSTSGTSASYSYDDVTALPGSFYEYKVSVWAKVGNTKVEGIEKTTDGFSIATGVISGRITYGTGAGVDGAKVTLKRQNSDGNEDNGMRSLLFSGNDAGLAYSADSAEISNLFAGDFTVQMYIWPDNDKMNTNEGFYHLFNDWSKFSFRLRYNSASSKYQIAINTHDKESRTDAIVPARQWSHLTVVYKSDTKTATIQLRTIDGSKIINNLSPHTVTYSKKGTVIGIMKDGLNGSASTVGKAFSGYMDEFRFFTRALTDTEIERNFNHTMAGDETGLAIYYPLDEGLSAQSIAYDFSKSGGVNNGRHAAMEAPATSTTFLPTENQLSLMSYTDVNGNYTIRGVPFSGEGTSYTIRPEKGTHDFSPTSQSRFVSMNSLVHSGVDFEDVSSFPVSGKVIYAGTDYPVEGCNFYVDGVICSKDGEAITSDEEGKYTISVPIGKHYIQVKKNGHVFAQNGRYPEDKLNSGDAFEVFESEKENLLFVDSTLVNFTGRVVGGDIQGNKPVGFGLSSNNIGQTELVLSPVNTRYRLNVKPTEGNTIGYANNPNTVAVNSAKPEIIQSEAYRTGGTTIADCQSIIIRTDAATGEFSAMLPPLMYNLESMTVVNSNPTLNPGKPQVIDLSNPLVELSDTLQGKNGYELYTYNTILRQTYHSQPTFTVTQDDNTDGAFGVKSYNYEDDLGTLQIDTIYTVNNGEVTYHFPSTANGKPIFIKEDNYTFNLKGYEEYVNADSKVVEQVPLDGVIVTVNNGLSAEQAVYVEYGEGIQPGDLADLKSNQILLDSAGCAKYIWKAGLPNICEPYSRSITMYYEIGGSYFDWNNGQGLEGIILGDLPTGNNFVTAGPDKLLMILRDPPGSNSFAEWTSGSTWTKTTLKGTTFTENFGTKLQHKFGFKLGTITGTPGLGTINEAETKDDLTLGVKMESTGEDSRTRDTRLTITKTVSTSDAEEYVGAIGDVFIGTSTNIIFGKARSLGFHRTTDNKLELGLEDIMSTGMEYGTMFHYDQYYIENTLFPNLELMLRKFLQPATQEQINNFENTTDHTVYLTTLTPDNPLYGTKDTYKMFPPKKDIQPTSQFQDPVAAWDFMVDNEMVAEDSVKWVMCQLANWRKYLSQNEEAKVKAIRGQGTLLDNVSFSSGTTVSSSTESELGATHTWEWNVSAGLTVEDSFGFKISGFGLECTIEDETMGGTHESETEGNSDVTTFSYTLAEDGDDDAISVDIYSYDEYGPIFRTRGGQTCCPYEGEVVTKYYEPGTVIMDATMQIEVPKIKVDNPVIHDVPTGGAANFTLLLSNESEIDEDVYYRLLVTDESNPNGAVLTIDGRPVTDSRIIKIPAGQTITKALQLKQSVAGELDYDSIAVVLGSQCQFDPTSTWDVITDTVYISAHFVASSSPVDLALSSNVINTRTGTDLSLTFSNFDPNHKGQKSFVLQYKKQGSKDWSNLHEYVLKDEGNLNSTTELLPNGGNVTYVQPMSSFTDGEYLFRVLSVSIVGGKEVYRSSEELAVVKDTQRPRPLGQPEPTDGILDIGDDLSITFNESFLKGDLTQEANFMVTGVLNGATVAHYTALALQNTPEPASSTEASINLGGKDFSVDAWVNVAAPAANDNKERFLLSHGAGTNKFTVSVNAAQKMVVNIAGQQYVSQGLVPVNEWAFLSMNYKVTEDGGTLNASMAVDATVTGIFFDQPVAAYEGNGPLTIGKNTTGAIHELLLWDEAHNMSDALANRSKSKNPSTRHLIGYWKMDEGEGTSIRDYARNHNMTMPDETWYLKNVNKAVSLDGQSYMTLFAGDSPYCTDDDYSIELWVKGEEQDGEAQLIQAGEVSLSVDDEGQLMLQSGNTQFPVNSQITDNAWHHLALNVLRQGAAAVYVDGQRKLTTSSAKVGNMATDNIIVGAKRKLLIDETDGLRYTYDNYFKGLVDEIRIWDATLNANQLLANRKVRLTGNEPGLVFYYPFETKELDSHQQLVVTGTPKDQVDKSEESQHVALSSSATQLLNYTDDAPALREKPEETNVSFSFTASDTKIVIDIDEDPANIEGCTLNFVVKDVCDANGNYSMPAVWSAFVNRKELVWKDASVSCATSATNSATFTATISNNSGKQQMWTLSGMPSWLQASTEYGTTNPLEETTVTFTVSPATPIGKYEETVYLKGNNGIEAPLTVNVKVKGDEPNWAVNKTNYRESMNIIGNLYIIDQMSEDEDDIIAAFIDDECRGLAHPVYDKRYDSYFVTLNIYDIIDDEDAANKADNPSQIEFKAYDASTGVIYPVVKPYEFGQTSPNTVIFNANDLMGRFAQPMMLTATDEVEQNIDLAKGWNWTSLGVKPEAFTVNNVFSKAHGKVEFVKGFTNSFEYDDEDDSWLNGDATLNNREMYAVQTNEALTLSVTGHRVKSNEEPITVKNGWTWVAFNGLSIMSLDEGLNGMIPRNDEIIKSQHGVAYYDSYEWKGNLKQLTPGLGYKIQGKQNRTFTYPTKTATGAAARMADGGFGAAETAGTAETTGTTETTGATGASAFTPVDYRSYPANMVLIAQTVSDGFAVGNVEVGVFAGEECREAAVSDEDGMIYITIPGDEPCELTFRAAIGNSEFVISNLVLRYETDAVIGTPRAPFIINLGDATGIAEIVNSKSVNSNCYDLQGRKLTPHSSLLTPHSSLRKGVYIINGQKKVK